MLFTASVNLESFRWELGYSSAFSVTVRVLTVLTVQSFACFICKKKEILKNVVFEF